VKRIPAALAAEGIFPDTAEARSGHLVIGGCDVTELAASHGTPLYVYDEASLRGRARAFREALRQSYPGRSVVCYASKAYAAPWIARLFADEDLSLDVVSGGELRAALVADVARERIYFHGNNKGEEEIAMALRESVGRIVVDNLDEVSLVGRLAAARGRGQAVLLRVSPGVDPRTHAHLKTGTVDTKFGLGIASGAAEEGVRTILAQRALDLRGYHAHIGSQIHEVGPFEDEIAELFAFAAAMRDRHGVALREISPGGGYAVRYTPDDPPADVPQTIRRVGSLAAAAAREHGFIDPYPEVSIEPGRSLVAPAAVALYRVGSVKRIPGGRTYVAVDGGMADNIRPTAYGATYTAVLADRLDAEGAADVAIAGKYCETGDILIQHVDLPLPRVGDLIAIPAAGAYHMSMASNYNLALRPAVVVVADGRARLVRRRETYDDLFATEVASRS
jgi:diaminopimelate decarboxylase